MDTLTAQYLIALFFIGAPIPALADTPSFPKGATLQFIFGLVLLVLSMLHIVLVH